MENIFFILTKEEEKMLAILIDIVEKHTNVLFQKIDRELSPFKFEHIHTLHPFEFNQFVKEQAEAIIGFFRTKEVQWVSLNGQLAARKGLDSDFIFTLTNVFETLFSENIPQNNNIVFIFAQKMLKFYYHTFGRSFHQEEKQQIYDEQKRLLKASLTTTTIQQAEFAQKERKLQQEKIEALKESRQRIKEENEGRKSFIIKFAHLIKMPLLLLLNFIVKLIKEAERLNLPKEFLSLITQIENAGNELSKKINDILDTEKILLKKKMYTHDEIVPVSKIVSAKLELYKNIIEPKKITLTHDLEPDLYSCIAVDALDHVLDNLLDNAVRYNWEKDGKIHAECKKTDNSIIMTIRNTGFGIPKTIINRLFTPYQKLTYLKQEVNSQYKAVNNIKGGMGAGLAIAKGILKEVHGKISVTSKVGKETTVTVELQKQSPRGNKKYRAAERIKLAKPVSRRQLFLKEDTYDPNKFIILIIDDEIDFCAMAYDYLHEDFNVYFAENGIKALRKLETIPKPNAIIIDAMMDEMDGPAFYETIRKDSNFKDVYIFFITGKTGQVEKINALKKGVVDYIYKPFSFEEFTHKLNSILNKHKIIEENINRRLRKRLLEFIDEPEIHDLAIFRKRCAELKLTKRHIEVAQYAIKGWLNKEIAAKLNLSTRTVDRYLSLMYQKIHVKNRVEFTNLLTK